MKIQDIIFLITLFFLLFKKNHTFSILTGLICITLSIPLFSLWIFFTAERLTWYGAGFIFLSIIQKNLIKKSS